MATSETEAPGDKGKPQKKRGVPEGLWMSCDDCGQMIYKKDSHKLFNVCPTCGYHFYLDARGRIASVLDDNTFDEWDANLAPPTRWASPIRSRMPNASSLSRSAPASATPSSPAPA